MSKLAHSNQETMDWVDRQLSMDDDYRHKDNGPPEDEINLPPFITALKNGGTKEEAIFALERMWEEQCGLRAEIHGLRSILDEIDRYAKKLRKSCDLVGPSEYHHDVKAMKVWSRALYHEGKVIAEMVRSGLPSDDRP